MINENRESWNQYSGHKLKKSKIKIQIMARQTHAKCYGEFSCLFGFGLIRFISIKNVIPNWVNLAQNRYFKCSFRTPGTDFPAKRVLNKWCPANMKFMTREMLNSLSNIIEDKISIFINCKLTKFEA